MLCWNEKANTAVDSLDNTASIYIFKLPNTSNIKNIEAILSCWIFIIMSAILKWKWSYAGHHPNSANSYDLLHCVKMSLVLWASQNAWSQLQNQLCKSWSGRTYDYIGYVWAIIGSTIFSVTFLNVKYLLFHCFLLNWNWMLGKVFFQNKFLPL